MAPRNEMLLAELTAAARLPSIYPWRSNVMAHWQDMADLSRRLIADVAQKGGLPSIGIPLYASRGGLLGYSVETVQMFRHAATFVDKILKGAKPGDIPIEQVTRFKTIVNLKTAHALGIEVPPAVLAPPTR